MSATKQIARAGGHAAIGVLGRTEARVYGENLAHALEIDLDDVPQFVTWFMEAYEGK